MKKGLLTVVLSVLFSVLAAYGVVKAATVNDGDNVTSTENGTVTKTVNLAQSDYPDLTYAAESMSSIALPSSTRLPSMTCANAGGMAATSVLIR